MKVFSLASAVVALAVALAPAAAQQNATGNSSHVAAHAAQGPDMDLRHDGEALFCDAVAAVDLDEGDVGGKECRRSWRYAISASCSPVCRAYGIDQQQQREGHASLYARETCEQRGRSACMATCVADQLIATGGRFDPVKDKDSADFISSLIFSYGDAAQPEKVAWLANIKEDVVSVTGRNASVLGEENARQASDYFSGFWEEVCASGGETRFGAAFCTNEFKDTTKDPSAAAATIHFAYLDGPSTPSFLQRQASARRGDSALRRASKVESKTGPEFVRRWVEAAFLREGQRVARCSKE